jgi:hypothetical protein
MTSQTGERDEHIHVEGEWIGHVNRSLKVLHGALDLTQSCISPAVKDLTDGIRLGDFVQPAKILPSRIISSHHFLRS